MALKVKEPRKCAKGCPKGVDDQIIHRIDKPRFLHIEPEYLIHAELEYLPDHANRDSDAERQKCNRERGCRVAIAGKQHKDEQKAKQAEPHRTAEMQHDIPPEIAFVKINYFAQKQCSEQKEHDRDKKAGGKLDADPPRKEARRQGQPKGRKCYKHKRRAPFKHTDHGGKNQHALGNAHKAGVAIGLHLPLTFFADHAYVTLMHTGLQTPLRLASYNIRAGLGTDLRRDPSRSLAVIATLGADIIALQEADFRIGQRPSALPRKLISDITGLVPLPVAINAVSLGWHGIALLARPEVMTRDVHRFDLPGHEPRGAVVVDLETRLGPMRVVGVHLGLLRSARRRQLDHIRAQLAQLAPLPTVIMGDFNEWSTQRGLGRIARDYAVLTPQRTFPSRLPVASLDRFAHCASLDLRVIAPPAKAKGAQPSDHLPVLAEAQPI